MSWAVRLFWIELALSVIQAGWGLRFAPDTLSKAAFLVMAIFGVATLWMAVVADSGASLIVVANALRLLRE